MVILAGFKDDTGELFSQIHDFNANIANSPKSGSPKQIQGPLDRFWTECFEAPLKGEEEPVEGVGKGSMEGQKAEGRKTGWRDRDNPVKKVTTADGKIWIPDIHNRGQTTRNARVGEGLSNCSLPFAEYQDKLISEHHLPPDFKFNNDPSKLQKEAVVEFLQFIRDQQLRLDTSDEENMEQETRLIRGQSKTPDMRRLRVGQSKAVNSDGPRAGNDTSKEASEEEEEDDDDSARGACKAQLQRWLGGDRDKTKWEIQGQQCLQRAGGWTRAQTGSIAGNNQGRPEIWRFNCKADEEIPMVYIEGQNSPQVMHQPPVYRQDSDWSQTKTLKSVLKKPSSTSNEAGHAFKNLHIPRPTDTDRPS
ncbi:hypothetical protein OG21DRAFT_1525777 [Imleria badia]|nr:hypothetical protein OG21DRAFT_1525777 [Imleria badia]